MPKKKDNVEPITKKKDKKEELRTADYYRIMSTHINGGFTNLFAGEVHPFPHKYHSNLNDDGSTCLLVEQDNQVVRHISSERFQADVIRFTGDKLAGHEYFGGMVAKQAVDLQNFWRLVTEPIEPPPSFRFKSEPGLCFSRMEFDPVYNDDGKNCPLFRELCSRIESTEEAFRAFIGSIFIENTNREQYLYLHGGGMNGKGSTIRLLERCLGPAFGAMEPPVKGAQHWNEGLVGKRLIVFSDINDTKFTVGQKFKMITGDDPIYINPKGDKGYTTKINCKFIVASNDLPHITGQKSDQRRAIFCDIKDITVEEDEYYEAKLWAEAPYIIGWCINTFNKIAGGNKKIPFDMDVNVALADDMDGDHEGIFTEYFKLDDTGFVTSSELSRVFRNARLNGGAEQKLRDFRKWLKYKHGIKAQKIKSIRGYHGMRIHNKTQGLTDHSYDYEDSFKKN